MAAKSNYKSELLEILDNSGAIKYEKRGWALPSGRSDYFIDTDCLWADPKSIEATAEILENRLKQENFDKLVGLTKINYEYGTVPLASIISYVTGIPLVVSEEIGLLDHRIHGNLQLGDKVIILDDLTELGYSLLGVIKELNKEWDSVEKVISLVDMKAGAEKLLTKHEISTPINPILTIDDVIEYHSNLYL